MRRLTGAGRRPRSERIRMQGPFGALGTCAMSALALGPGRLRLC
jgi:hypothetical protein